MQRVFLVSKMGRGLQTVKDAPCRCRGGIADISFSDACNMWCFPSGDFKIFNRCAYIFRGNVTAVELVNSTTEGGK